MQNLSIPLSDEELEKLDHFLLNRGYPEPEEAFDGAADEGVIVISELDGFFTAIVSGPEPVLPSRWLPALWGDVEPLWESEDQAGHIVDLLMRHMNGIANSLMDPELECEPLFMESEVEGRLYTIVDEWCSGYMRGVGLSQPQWDRGGETLQQLLEPITLFSDEAGWTQLKEMPHDEVELWQKRVPIAARNIYVYWLLRRDDLRPQPVVRNDPRVGRNDPCPCGSGKKYKKCCLH